MRENRLYWLFTEAKVVCDAFDAGQLGRGNGPCHGVSAASGYAALRTQTELHAEPIQVAQR